MGPEVMMFIFRMLSFKPAFSLSSFTFIKRLFSSSSLSAIRVVSSAYLRLLIFPLAILIPACASSSSAFHMMYSAYKVNKQGDNIPPWCTPFPIWNQSVVPCPALTVASWPAYRFLRRQVRYSGIPIYWRIFHSLLWSTTVKGFGIVNKVDVFLELSSFFDDPVDVAAVHTVSKSQTRPSDWTTVTIELPLIVLPAFESRTIRKAECREIDPRAWPTYVSWPVETTEKVANS